MNEQRKKPIDYDQLFPGRFLKAGLLLGKQVTMVISAVDIEALPQDSGGDKVRGILSFERVDKQLVLNSTNGQCLKAMFGKEVQKWVGKPVTFAPEKDRFGNETVDAIRVVGSPELKEELAVSIIMPRRKPKTRKLQPTRPNNGNGQRKPSGNEPPPDDGFDDADDYNRETA